MLGRYATCPASNKLVHWAIPTVRYRPIADVHIDSAGIKMAVLFAARLARIGGTMIAWLVGVTVIVEVINNG